MSATRGMSSPVLVGRAVELARLVDTLAQRPCLVLLEGEAGVGKTRLVRELAERSELGGAHVLVGRSHPVREPLLLGAVVEALGPVRDLINGAKLSPLTGALRGLLPELASRLPTAPKAVGDPSAERHLVYRGLRELLGHLGPTVLVLEDMHWSDEATEDFLYFLGAQPPDDLGVVITYRREDVPAQSRLLRIAAQRGWARRIEHIELHLLSADDVSAMIAAILQSSDVSPEFAAYVHERTSGLPLAVEEIVHLVRDRKDIIQSGDRWFRRALGDFDVPASIRDAVLERAHRLTRNARAIVDAAAVLDTPADEALLTHVAGLRAAAGNEALSEVLGAAVLVEADGETYGFRHVLAQQAAYEALARPERQRLHLRAAVELESREPRPVARLAYHYRSAHRHVERARCDEEAADLALAAGDNAAAVEYLLDALQSPGPDDQARARMAATVARAAIHGLARPEDVIDCVRTAVAGATLSDADRGEVRLWLGLMLNVAGREAEARAQWSRCVTELTERPGVMARAMTWLASPWTVEGHVSEHLAWLERAMDLVADDRFDAAQRSVVVLANTEIRTQLGELAMVAGDDRPQVLDPCSVVDEQDFIRHLWGRAGALLQIGHYARARAVLDEVQQAVDQLGYAAFAPLMETAEIVYAVDTGAWGGLQERARMHAMDIATFPIWSIPAVLILGQLALATGANDEAEEHFREALRVASSTGAILGIAAATAGLARIRLLEGDAAAAVATALEGVEAVRRKGIWVWGRWVMTAAVEALLEAGRKADAGELVEEFRAGLVHRDAPALHAELAMCAALVAEARGDGEAALAGYLSAREQYAVLPMRYEAAGATMRAGLLALDRGDRSGEALVREALTTFEELGATTDAARSRQALRLRKIPVPRPPVHGRQKYGPMLSPREREIAVLAAEGRTNPEIAAALYLSSWTV